MIKNFESLLNIYNYFDGIIVTDKNGIIKIKNNKIIDKIFKIKIKLGLLCRFCRFKFLNFIGFSYITVNREFKITLIIFYKIIIYIIKTVFCQLTL